MVESIQNRIYYRLNQLQIESTMNRIYLWLNLSMVESTYGCRESQKSKKVKNPADYRTLVLYQAKAPIRQAAPGIGPGPDLSLPHRGLYTRQRAGKLELEAGKQAGSWKL